MRFAARALIAGAVCLSAGLAVPTVAAGADTQPPTAPSNLRLTGLTPTIATFAFTGSTDNVGLKWYVIRIDGAWSQPTTSPSRTDFGGLLSNTAYTARVVAVDRAGNESAPSGPVSFTTPSWSKPGGLRVTAASGGTVSLAWDRQSDMDPYRFLVYDGGNAEAVTKVERTTMQRLAPGVHTFTVRGMRANGDLTPASSAVTVTVASTSTDRTAPASPGNVVTTLNEEAYDWTTTWTASTDDVDPQSSIAYDTLQLWAGGLFTAHYGVTGTSVTGAFASAVRAVDRAGNRSAPTTSSVVVP
jgi:chitinase